MTHQPRTGSRLIWHPNARALRDDRGGAMLLALFFALGMTALMVVASTMAVSGQIKTRNTRDFAQAQQASDLAFANLMLHANLGLLTSSPMTQSATNGGVTWTWTATQTADPLVWDVEVGAEGERIDRNFKAKLRGNRVLLAAVSTSTGDIDYIVENAENYAFGFFGDQGVSFNGAADLDGYNGVDGVVGSNQTLSLDTAHVDAVVLHAVAANGTSGRCSGNACPIARREEKAGTLRFPKVPAASCNASLAASNGNWNSSSGSDLVAGRCYRNLRFNSDYDATTDGVVYVWGDVSVQPNRVVNMQGNPTTPNTQRLRIAMANGGAFDMQPQSKFAGAVFNPSGNCDVNASSGSAFNTRWIGAATCQTLNINGPARLRYDGALRALNADTASGDEVFYFSDYQVID